VIDPVITYSTYLGGDGSDQAVDIAVDDSGSAYVLGRTFVSGTGYSWSVTKLSPDGVSIVYTTYLGSPRTFRMHSFE